MKADEIRKLIETNPEAVVKLILEMEESIVLLTNRVKELEERLNKDSNNSSKPPSSDSVRKKIKRKPKKKQKQRKSGGKKGHKGKTLEPVTEPDNIIVHKAEKCEYCDHSLKDTEAFGYDKRQVFDIPPIAIEITEHRAEQKICPYCGKEVKASFPEGVTHKTQYGKRIKSLVVYLSQYQLLPYERTVEFFKDIVGYSISQGSIYNFIKSAYKSLEQFEERLKEKLIASDIVHFDETGVMCGKKLNWIHTACNAKYTFYAMDKKRGSEATDKINILPNFKGTAMHDFWKPYSKYNCNHIFCNAHIVRELTGIYENSGQKWSLEFKNMLFEIKNSVDNAKYADKLKLSQYRINKYQNLYDKIIEKGFLENPLKSGNKHKRGRKKQTKARNLLDRLCKWKIGILAFMYNFTMPYTNNIAEPVCVLSHSTGRRDLRMIKVHQKISNCFRSIEGADFFCRIRSYISTVKKNEHSVIRAIENIFLKNEYMTDLIAE